jgi:hypothetical protein
MSLKTRVCVIFVLNLMMVVVVVVMMMHNIDYEHAYTFYIKFLCVNNNYKYGNGVQNLVVAFASLQVLANLLAKFNSFQVVENIINRSYPQNHVTFNYFYYSVCEDV